MKFIIIHGPPGSGKTHLRKEKYPDDTFYDMDDLRLMMENMGITGLDNYYERMRYLMQRLSGEHTNPTNDIVIVEGIFAPESDSYKWLINALKDMGAKYEFERPEFNLYSAVQHLLIDFEVDHNSERLKGRLMLLVKYVDKF